MRHKIRHRKRKCVTLSAILSLSKPKTVLTAPREAHQLGSKGFFIRQRGQWTTDIDDSGAPPPPQEKGGGQAGGARDAANSLLQFLRPRAETTQPPPAAPPKAAETTAEGWVLAQQQQYINTERPAYDGVAPIIEQMLPEIAQADENTKNTSIRDALAVARGYVTGVRANGTTTGSALWAELLQREEHCRHVLSGTWGMMHTTESTKIVFFWRIRRPAGGSGSTAHRHSSQKVRSSADDAEPATGMGMGSSRPDGPTTGDAINHNSPPKTPRTRAQNKVFHQTTGRRLPRGSVEPDDKASGSSSNGQHSDTTVRDTALPRAAERSRTYDGTTRISTNSRRKRTRSTTTPNG